MVWKNVDDQREKNMIAWDGVPTSTLMQEVAGLTRQWELADECEATPDPDQSVQLPVVIK